MIPDIETQIEIEEIYNKNQMIPRLKEEFSDSVILDHCEEEGIPVPFALSLLAMMVIHKRATLSTLVGILYKHFMEDSSHEPSQDQLQACADMLMQAAQADLVDWDPVSGKIIQRIDVSPELYTVLEQYQYPLPLLVEPRKVTSNRETGYHSPGSCRGSIILRDNHHDFDVCLDHINRVNAIPLSINMTTANMIANQWRNLDRRKEGEDDKAYAQRLDAFEKYDRTSRDVLSHLFMTGNRFHLTHRYDKRGRCYAQGYHVNPQGNDWNKAVIEFAEGELINV